MARSPDPFASWPLPQRIQDVVLEQLARLGSDAGGTPSDAGPIFPDRSKSNGRKADGQYSGESSRDRSNTRQLLSFDGLNHNDQRFANGGNQFSLEPPDQGLCAGNGFVIETVNDVLAVYNTSGNKLVGPVDLNTFYAYAAAINRTTGVRGPELTDPSCYFDAATQRWFHVVLTLEVVPSGANGGRLTGPNRLDIAVSQTSDPTGTWSLYHLPVQDDGTQGTPNHGCSAGSPPATWRTNPNACIGDYPHIGADANGFYVSTNEYSLFGPEYKAAQVYASAGRDDSARREEAEAKVLRAYLPAQLGEPLTTDLKDFCALHYGAPEINVIREAIRNFIDEQLARDPELKKKFEKRQQDRMINRTQNSQKEPGSE